MTTDNGDRKTATLSLIESMKERYPEKGFLIHPGISFEQQQQQQDCSDGGGIGVVATADISKDEILLVIPESSRLCIANIVKNNKDKNNDNDDLDPGLLKKLCKKIETKCAKWSEAHIPSEFSLTFLIMYILNQKKKYGPAKNEWTMQASTWPFNEYMKKTSIYYLDTNVDVDSNNKKQQQQDQEEWIENIGKNIISGNITERCRFLHQIFETVIYPMLKNEKKNGRPLLEHFCAIPSSSSTDNHDADDSTNKKIQLWETFRYAFALIFSRSHGEIDPELIPLIELFNGNTDEFINVDIAKGKWPFIKGPNYVDECGLSCSAIYAKRDITKGEELILSYGSLQPHQFLIKYGTIPKEIICHENMMDSLDIYCPPDFVPTDSLRIRALQGCNGYPLDDFRVGNLPLAQLSNMSLWSMRNSSAAETPDLQSIRQYLILGQLASNDEVQLNINTGRLRVMGVTTYDIGRLLCQVLDYNIEILSGSTSEVDIEKANNNTTDISSQLCLGRVCQRETLLQWKHVVCNKYNLMMQSDENNNDLCRVCGRSYPQLTCSRCKWRGTSIAAHYCSRHHQRINWKHHKPNCKAAK